MNITYKATINSMIRDGGDVELHLNLSNGRVEDAQVGAKDAKGNMSITVKALALKDIKLTESFSITIKSDDNI